MYICLCFSVAFHPIPDRAHVPESSPPDGASSNHRQEGGRDEQCTLPDAATAKVGEKGRGGGGNKEGYEG